MAFLAFYLLYRCASYLCTLHLSNDAWVDYSYGFLKQALHDALMKQDDLLAYIDSQAEAKLLVSLHELSS